jgi:hypothetical protein
VVLLFASAACGGAEQPRVEVGTGLESFVPLAPRAPLPLYAGPQGGHHLVGAIRSSGLTPRRMKVRFNLTPVGEQVPAMTYGVGLSLEERGGEHVVSGLFLVVPEPAQIDGRSCLLRIDVVDADGRAASDERTVVPIRD